MPAPFVEIIGTPLTLWLAPVGTAFPLVNAAPSVNWTQIGASGNRHYGTEGVSVSSRQVIENARPAGATGPVKAWRTEEDLMVKVTLWDHTLEQIKAALNGNAVTTTAAGTGTPGTKKIGMSRGLTVTEYALLARGVSAYDETMAAQFEVPRCFNMSSPEIVYRKGQPAGVMLEFQALEDSGAASAAERFGRLVMQHQAPL